MPEENRWLAKSYQGDGDAHGRYKFIASDKYEDIMLNLHEFHMLNCVKKE